MSYERKTIAKIMDEIYSQKIMLPSIQRKYVWEEEQITRLMDSIMRGYPFGTFLFWEIKKQTVNKYPMYEFIRDYSDYDLLKNNSRVAPFSLSKDNINDTVRAVLDGQQRLTSLYISLMGSLSKKMPKKRKNNVDAYPKKELYFNLLSEENDDSDILYDFSFLTEEESKNNTQENKLWYKVKNILQFPDQGKLTKMATENWKENNSIGLIIENISKLFQRLKSDELVNYFEVSSDNIDDVLDIFVRVNSGGTVLSRTDLLFSTIVANWQEARDEIDDFLVRINKIGECFAFNSDFIMRSCLYVLNMPILMKVDNFSQENVEEIKTKWGEIKKAIEDTIILLSDFGFNAENIISSNAILPIIYHRFHNGEKAFSDTKINNDIRKYFVVSQIKKIFGGHSNQTLDTLRKNLKENNKFDFNIIKNIQLPDGKTFAIDEKDGIEKWITTWEKGPYTFLLLSLLYPSLKHSQKIFEQDHLHPDSGFKKNKLKELGLSEDEIDDWLSKKDTLPNLQLLESKENESKNDALLKDWVEAGHDFYFNPKVSLEFKDFINFYNEREKLIEKELKNILND